MSRSYWPPVIAVVGLVLTSAQGAEPVPQHQGPNHSADQSNPDIAYKQSYFGQPAAPFTAADVDRLTSPVKVEEGNIKPDRENQRAEEDLTAQKKMATSAMRMFWVGLFEIFVTIVGVVLVGLTLYHTKRAADSARASVDEAKRAADAARESLLQSEEHTRIGLKAYLAIQPEKIEFSLLTKNGAKGVIEVKIGCTMINSGSTPANDVRVCADIRAIAWPPVLGVFDYDGKPEAQTNQSIGKTAGGTQQFTKLILVDFARLKSGEDRVILVGKLIYRDIWQTEYPSTFEGSLVGVEKLVEACEFQVPGVGPQVINSGASFEWHRPIPPQQKSENN